MKRFALYLVFVLLISGLSSQVSQSLVGVDSLRIGTPFQFVIDTGFPLREIVVPDTLSSFRVLEQSIEARAQGSRARLSIVPLRVGALSFPKLELKNARLLGSGGETDAFRVFVLRSRAEEDTLLRDIKPLREYPYQLPFWLYLVILLLALLLAALLLIMAFKKPPVPLPQPAVQATPQPQTAPHLLALRNLDELQQSGVLYRDEIAYHFRLSMILREFLELSFGFGAIQMTTSEIAERMNLSHFQQMEEYLAVLRYCDLVKFAKHDPGIEEIISRTEALRSYLKKVETSVNV